MPVLGVVAEYDPFHAGHAFHLAESRRLVRPDAVYVALSPCWTQRGLPAFLSPYDRAACALASGADAVFALPVLWTLRDAEHYALGAVSLLAGLGITHLAFGAEVPDLSLLQPVADLLEDQPAPFQQTLKAVLSRGTGYPAAQAEAAESCIPGAGLLLFAPNNTLAVCYLRVIRRLRLPLIPVIIPRRGSYHASGVHPDAPSASAVREALRRGDYGAAFSSLPPVSASRVRQALLSAVVPDPAAYDLLLRYALQRMPEEAFSRLPDAAEGLGDALSGLRFSACSFAEISASLTSRRYSSARVSRLCAHALLGVTAERLRRLSLPSDTLLLGLRPNHGMTAGWKDLPVRIWPNASEWRSAADLEDLQAWRLWSLCCRQPATLPFTEKTVTAGPL